MAKKKNSEPGSGEKPVAVPKVEQAAPVEAINYVETDRYKMLAFEYAEILAGTDDIEEALKNFRDRVEHEAIVNKRDRLGNALDEVAVDATLKFVESLEAKNLPSEIIEKGFTDYLTTKANQRQEELMKLSPDEFLKILRAHKSDYDRVFTDYEKRLDDGEISKGLADGLVEGTALAWAIDDLQKANTDLVPEINAILGRVVEEKVDEPVIKNEPVVATEPAAASPEPTSKKTKKEKKNKDNKAGLTLAEQLAAAQVEPKDSSAIEPAVVPDNIAPNKDKDSEPPSAEPQFFTWEKLSDVPHQGDAIELVVKIEADGSVQLPEKKVVDQTNPKNNCLLKFNVAHKMPGVATGEYKFVFRVLRSHQPNEVSPNNFETTVLVGIEPGYLEHYSRVRPIGYVRSGFRKEAGYYILPDGGRLYKHDLPFDIDPATGLRRQANGPGEYPEIDLTGFDGRELHFGNLIPPPEKRQYGEIERVLLHYLMPPKKFSDLQDQADFEKEYLDRMGWPGGLGSTKFGGRINAESLFSDLKTGRMTPEAMAAMRKQIQRASREYPLPVVVSARGQQISRGFDAVLEAFKEREKNGDNEAKYLRGVARAAADANSRLMKSAEDRQPLDPEEEKKLINDYVRFFRELDVYEFHHRQEPNRILREHFFPSDLDGETAVALFRRAGIDNYVIPFTPNQVRSSNNFSEYVMGATHIDISHGTGILVREVPVEGLTDPESLRPVIFIDEDGKNFESAAHASRSYLSELGFLNGLDGRENYNLNRLLDFIDALDSYTGPYQDKDQRKKIYENYAQNIYGLAEQFVRYGRPDLVRAFFQSELPQIDKKIKVPLRGNFEEYRREFLNVLVNYDASRFFKKVVPDLYQEISKRIADDKKRSDESIEKLEQNGFVVQTAYGRALVDPFGLVRLRGLAAFAAGFDVYVGYDWRYKQGTVLLAPGKKGDDPRALLPADFITNAAGESKGTVVKNGKMFVMNQTSLDLDGLSEIIKALKIDPTQIVEKLEQFINLEAVRNHKANKDAWQNLVREFVPDYAPPKAAAMPGVEPKAEPKVEPKKDAQKIGGQEISFARESYLIVHYIGKLETAPFEQESVAARRELVAAVATINQKIKSKEPAVSFAERRAGEEAIKRAQDYMRSDLERLQNRLTTILSANIGRLRTTARGLGVGVREYLENYVAHMVENTKLDVYFSPLNISADKFKRDWVSRIISG